MMRRPATQHGGGTVEDTADNLKSCHITVEYGGFFKVARVKHQMTVGNNGVFYR